MKKLIYSIILTGFAQQIVAQNFYLVPHIRIKADVNRNNYDYADDFYFKISSPNVSFEGLSPLLLGANIEYKRKKSIYGIGLIVGDQANSEINIEFTQYDANAHYTNYLGKIRYENYAGWNIYAKVPLIFKTQLFSINAKQDPTKSIMTCNLNTGLNLQFLKVKNQPTMINPMSYGKTHTDFGDYIEIVGYASHLNRSFNMSMNLGLDFDFYIKGKRSIVAQLYFEQGFRKITQTPMIFYLNDQNWGGFSSISRGSALNFKLAFPIEILKKFTNNSL